ncbi:ABC transporter substrate-binding protein [Devosia nitrariae]|uniref:ABC transporter substrate-binding protein n=2 Tax=Devosia nitrariae TaxID=2071872 RepID=A0ABQ5WBH2_9HYPH|nr:ABC transporter substrate-binding protein [Devosia nitrariae]
MSVARGCGPFRSSMLAAGIAAVLLGSTAAAWAQERGGILTVSQSADAQPINILALRAGNAPWIRNVFETLTLVDPQTFQPQPVLAQSWTLAEDGLSMDITLRDDVTFHTGRPMTAEDVKFSFETAATPESASQVGFIAREFESIEVTGDHSLTIAFKRPLSNIFDFFEETYIIDRETYDQREDGSQVVGTGPYMFSEWSPGASIILKRYENYRSTDTAWFDEIEFAVIPDPTASIAALRSNRTQITTGLTPRDTVEFIRNPQFSVLETGGTIYPLGVNVTIPPFDDKLVRQAIAYAVDRDRINDQVFLGTGTVTDLFWSPAAPGYSGELANHYTYDPDRARELIAEAGAEGAAIPIIVPAIPSQRSIFEIVQNNLREVGLVPEAVVLDVADFDQRQIAGDLGAAFLLLHGQVGFSSPTLLSSLPSLRQGNPSAFWNDDYVALREAMLASATPEALGDATAALSEYMLDEAFSTVLVQAPGQAVMSSGLQGVVATVRGQLVLAGSYLE